MTPTFFKNESPVAPRQPKTDRLILSRFLRDKAKEFKFEEDQVKAAHAILVKWADLESSGKLAKLKETQLQGDFLGEVFSQALGYRRVVDNAETWELLQHEGMPDQQTPDATLGRFRHGQAGEVLAVIELKGSKVHLDRDRSQGRTAVDQCWDYLVNTPPTCRWGIVSNMVSFRLYERGSTKRKYEHFTLQDLRDFQVFKQFYLLFHKHGLVEEQFGRPPRAVTLLEQTLNRQREVGASLYDTYSKYRSELIGELHIQQHHPLNEAIEMAQRLLDRIIFVAFCEDRGLLPEKTIAKAYTVNGFHQVTNPRWRSFKNLFRLIDVGDLKYNIPPYNGGLFAVHPVDDLELLEDQWTEFFSTVSSFDFADEVNLEVLGHLFEQSITELEKLKETGFFGGDARKADEYARMPQSAKRKQLGVYYTPPELTSLIVRYTVEELIAERFASLAVEAGVAEEEARRGAAPEDRSYWRGCLEILLDLKVVDPACGSGAFLFQAYNTLEQHYNEVVAHLANAGDPQAADLESRIPHMILGENLYGADLSPEAVEITQLALWIRSASRGQKLASLSHNMIHGNSLVQDPAVDPAGFEWRERFPEVFDRPQSGFDCVIGNPPWERVKLQEREFFSLPAPEIATATNAAARRKLVDGLESKNPALYKRYEAAKASADELLTYLRKSERFPLTGQGDINFYAVFAELASQLVSPRGRVGMLTPSGIASDMTTKDFFATIAESDRLIRLYDFENRTKKLFPDVDGRFKFCILNFGGEGYERPSPSGVANLKPSPSGRGQGEGYTADFAFFLHQVEELEDKQRHIPLSGKDIRLLNPNTRTCPIFRTRRDAEITKAIYRRVPVLIDESRTGPTRNPWGIRFGILFHQAKDAHQFISAKELAKTGSKLEGNVWRKRGSVYSPCYEAKMAQQYDHRAASVRIEANWARQGQPTESSIVDRQNPEFVPIPRWWASEEAVRDSYSDRERVVLFSFRKVTSPTNSRTLLAAFLPLVGAIDSLQFVFFNDVDPRLRCCLMANFNALPLDYALRQKIGNVNVNYFLVEQLPVFPPDTYEKPCPWAPKTKLEKWISERVLKLTCTAVDMLPLAEACDFTGGSFKKEYGGRLNKWDESERDRLKAELDAAYFHLYGIGREDAEYILSTFKGIHEQRPLLPGARTTAEFILAQYDELADR